MKKEAEVCPECGWELKKEPCERIEIDGKAYLIHTKCNKKTVEEKVHRMGDGPMPI